MPEETIYTTRGVITSTRGFDDLVQRAATDEDAASLLALARDRALNPEAFDRYPPVFFSVNASTNAIDSYSTVMGDSTLANFAADAAEGRAVLDSHNSRENGFGKSLTGEVRKEGGVKLMRSSFFTIPGYRHKDFDTDSLIAGIETGMHSDISVGFYIPAGEGRMTCSVCGNDMLDWENCRHFAGMVYRVDTDNGPEDRVAIGTIENARLSEYSLVYDGATPGAAVVKAIRLAESGEIDGNTVERLQQTYPRYRNRIPMVRSYALGAPTPAKENIMLEELMRIAEAHNIRVRTGATEEDLLALIEKHIDGLNTDRANAEDDVRVANEKITELTAAAAANERIIEDGKRYREAVVEEAIAAQIRTLNPEDAKKYKRDVHKRYFENMEIEDVLDLTRTYNTQSKFVPDSLTDPEGSGDKPAPVRSLIPGASRILARVHQDQ